MKCHVQTGRSSSPKRRKKKKCSPGITATMPASSTRYPYSGGTVLSADAFDGRSDEGTSMPDEGRRNSSSILSLPVTCSVAVTVQTASLAGAEEAKALSDAALGGTASPYQTDTGRPYHHSGGSRPSLRAGEVAVQRNYAAQHPHVLLLSLWSGGGRRENTCRKSVFNNVTAALLRRHHAPRRRRHLDARGHH